VLKFDGWCTAANSSSYLYTNKKTMPLSFTGFGAWALLLMLLAGIVHHLLIRHTAKKHSVE